VTALLERLLATTPDAVVANDPAGRIRMYNDAAERLFGYTASEARAWVHVTDLYHRPPDARRVSARLHAGPEHHIDVSEVELRRRDGQVIPVRLCATRAFDTDGTPLVLGVLTDLRERNGLRERLEDATGQVIASERRAAGMQVAVGASRQLAQPLTVALGELEQALETDHLPALARARLERAQLHLERIGGIAAELMRTATQRGAR
jgi:PAS domain S-box-containing protein